VTADQLNTLRAFVPGAVAERILAAGGEGERRIVTALVCDVVGSTPLGERLGPERFKVVMDQVLGRLISAVSRYEGTVAQVVGDGLLAFFGAPLTHEDDPERAVRAALEIRDTAAAYSREIEAAYGIPLAIRVGLNTGPVVLSRVTDVLHVAYNALGDTVTTATRLQSAAAPNTILAAEATTHLVSPLFDLRPMEPLSLKGKARPVQASEVVAARAGVSKPRGIAGLTSPLVGRDIELALFTESFQAVTEGRGRIVALVGEAGLGKSRLVAEGRRLSPHIRWLEGRCLSYGGGIPYLPFVDLLREWLGVTGADPEAKVRIELRAALGTLFGAREPECYPYLATLLGLSLEPAEAPRIADLSAESLQHQTFKVLREWAVSAAARQPLGLILDDLHWADPTSLALLEALLEVAEDAPVLLCLVFRPERTHGCWRLNDLARQRFPHRHVEIVLRPLGPVDTEHLVSNLLARPDFPAEIRGLILQKAEGNPFFIEEVIRELIEADVLVREADRWRAGRAVATLDIPDNVQGVLLSRIDRLPDEARRILQAASVIGRLFPFEILRGVVGGNGRLQAALTTLQRHELIAERRRLPQAEYRFSHALTQEVAYSTLLEEDRRRLHREVARSLETQHADRLEEISGLLAYHYDHAQDEVRALHFLVRAGDKARAEYADEEALRAYDRAVELMKRRGEWQPAAETLMKAALAHHIAFNFRAADLAYREAFEIMERLPSPAPSAHPRARLRISTLEASGLDAARSSDAPSWAIIQQAFESLLQFAPGMSVAPALAQSWEISPDGTRYVFRLHRDRQWSDGRPVTAHDIVYGWLRAMRGLNGQIFYDIAGARRYAEGATDDPEAVGVRALDDHTLDVRLEGPRAYFPFVATTWSPPMPQWAVEAHGENWTAPKHLVANGPFLITEWKPGSHARLRANPRYTGPRCGNVRDIELVWGGYHDPSLFESGQVDVQIFAVLDERRSSRLRDVLRPAPPLRTAYVFFRCDRPPFTDPRLRLAFAHATDRHALAHAGGPYVLPADGGLVPPALPGHSPGIGVPFDPERARQLLADAGYPGGRGLGPFTITVPHGWEARVVSEIPAQTWREVLGISVEITPVPAADYWRQLWTDPPTVGRSAWLTAVPDPDYFLRNVFHSTSVHNAARWVSARFDALVEEAQGCTDYRRRMALYHEADRLLVAEEAVIVPTVYTRQVALVHPRVRSWTAESGRTRWADLIVE
jgi:ABC-type transport system substrate-binding protein/class 3 adenylate cyclase